MNRIPEDPQGRRAFLERWAGEQRSRLAGAERRRRYAEQIDGLVARARECDRQIEYLKRRGGIPVVITKPSDLPADRASVFADLMLCLARQQWACPIVSECDEARWIAPKAVGLARRHRPDAPWILYMEDDVIPGPHFGLLPELLREAEEVFPRAGLVSFFSGAFDEPGWSLLPLKRFGWLQCVAIRNTEHLGGFWNFTEGLVTQGPCNQSAGSNSCQAPPTPPRMRPTPPSDVALATFLGTQYDNFALWCPSLVQHADLASVFSGAQLRRMSRSYEQAYSDA